VSVIIIQEEKPTEAVFDPMWAPPPAARMDLRDINYHVKIPSRFYADQPYMAPTADGGLLCVLTTGTGHEGSRGQHVLCMKTFDQGHTWQDITPIESPSEPESSWGVPFTAPSGRVFVFYIFNADDIRELPADNPPYPSGKTQRMDSHGYYVFRWSDDHGKTWSKERGSIPMREFEIDRNNSTGGAVRLFWNVGRAFSIGEKLFLPFHKVGGLGDGWFTSSEGGLMRSHDLLTIKDPTQATWATLPEGDVGIRSPQGGGSVAEEQNFVTLSDSSIFTVFRTIDGHPACAYSRDEGNSWAPSEYMQFADGRRMKHPRAANFVWKMKDGGYLYFFHNHGGRAIAEHPQRRTHCYEERNPIWFCRGWEVDTAEGKIIHWSQPEIAFYGDDPMVRISYPDFIEFEGKFLFSETEKSTARLHEVAPEIVAALSADQTVRRCGLKDLEPLVDWSGSGGAILPMPLLPAFIVRAGKSPYGSYSMRAGFCVDILLRIGSAPSALLENRALNGSGFGLEWTAKRTLRLRMCDGQTEAGWESDPVPEGLEQARFTINVDGGSHTICIYRDGLIDDGGEQRQFGWGRFSPYFRNTYAGEELHLSSGDTAIRSLKCFDRVLTSAEIGEMCLAEAPSERVSSLDNQVSLIG
jgi:hypothetical protein